MENKPRMELEILCDGKQPVDKQGDPIRNIILLSYDKQLVIRDIKRKALQFIHYFINCKTYGIESSNFVSGIIWCIDNNKRFQLGRYAREKTRFSWKSNL